MSVRINPGKALRALRRKHHRERGPGQRHPDGPIVVTHNGDDWSGPWAVAVECLCNQSEDSEIESVHYIYGPFTDRQSAETWAADYGCGLVVHVFRLWPVSNTEAMR